VNLDDFLSLDCPECGTPGPWRHLSAVGGCQRCCADDPRPVFVLPAYRRSRQGLVPVVHARAVLPAACYPAAWGTVHVTPGCRCPGKASWGW
jgi:hypothetical protein